MLRAAPVPFMALLATGALLLSPRTAIPGGEEASVSSRTTEASTNLPFLLGPVPPDDPSRLVSLSPALTDLVIELGAGELLVGVTRFCDSPSTQGLPRVGGFVDPSIEAVLALRPDLVVAEPSPGNREAVTRLAELGLTVRVLPHGGVAEVRRAILVLGEDLGRATRAQGLLNELDSDLEQVRAYASAQPPRRAALIYGREPLVLAGPGSFGHELLTIAGAKNVASGAKVAYPTYPLELLVAGRPEVIVETTMTGGRSGPLPHLGFARHEVIPGDLLLRPGPRLGESARLLFEALYPEAASDNDADASP